MKTSNFKEILLNVAVCAIACDGDIDEREINALKKIEKDSRYFSAVDLSEVLEKSLKNCMKNIEKYKNGVYSMLKKANLNLVQELTILEISLRIIAADEKELDSEKEFINTLRAYLDIEDFLIHERFGEIPYLTSKNSEFKLSDSDKNNITTKTKNNKHE